MIENDAPERGLPSRSPEAVREGPLQPLSKLRRMLQATQRGLPLLGSVEATPTNHAARIGALGSVKVLMATGLYKTAAGVIGQRLLEQNAGVLRTYLTVQLRSAEAASAALLALEDAIEHGSAKQLEQGPSKRAAIFLAARNIVEYERLFDNGSPERPLSEVPWEPTPPGRIDGWGRALDEMRFSLGASDAELLMLHHGFGLSAAEVAYVLGVGQDELTRKLDAGVGFAKVLLGDVFAGEVPPLEPILKDAFRVRPPAEEELGSTRTKAKVVPLPAGTVIGDRYEIEETIGGGEFAYVYRARDVRVPGHVVALKLLHRVARTNAAREGAIRELSLIASAFHPSLVQFKEHGWYEARLWFVMPYYEGETLLDRLGREPLPLEDALEYFERLARGLAALHAAGIRHQDIKPENVFLVELHTGATAQSAEVLPVLLDLGVAVPTGEMALAGTPMYFPPEVAGRLFDEKCDLPLTPKADVYALALSLLHSIEAPEVSHLEQTDVESFLKRRVLSVPEGPRAEGLKFLRGYFARWLARDPKERPTAGELADEIARIRVELRGGSARSLGRFRGGWVAAGMSSLLATAVISSDAPARPVAVVERATTHSGEAPMAESDQIRLLRHRLRTEERRSMALEDELSRLRRDELGLERPGDEAEPDPQRHDRRPTTMDEH